MVRMATEPSHRYWSPRYASEDMYHRSQMKNRASLIRMLAERDGIPIEDARRMHVDHITDFPTARSQGYYRLEKPRRTGKWRWVLYMRNGTRWIDPNNLQLLTPQEHQRKTRADGSNQRGARNHSLKIRTAADSQKFREALRYATAHAAGHGRGVEFKPMVAF